MKRNTIACRGETTSPIKYTDTMEQLRRYTSYTYKYGKDIQDLVRNLQSTHILKRDSIDEDDKDATIKRSWGKR